MLVLLFPGPKLPNTIVINASGSVASGVLMQDQGNGLQLLTFLSRQLTPMEQKDIAHMSESRRQSHTAYRVGGTTWRGVSEV